MKAALSRWMETLGVPGVTGIGFAVWVVVKIVNWLVTK